MHAFSRQWSTMFASTIFNRCKSGADKDFAVLPAVTMETHHKLFRRWRQASLRWCAVMFHMQENALLHEFFHRRHGSVLWLAPNQPLPHLAAQKWHYWIKDLPRLFLFLKFQICWHAHGRFSLFVVYPCAHTSFSPQWTQPFMRHAAQRQSAFQKY